MSSNVKGDALGEGGAVLTEVRRAGLAAHVELPRVGAGFTPAAGFFFTTECAADFGAGGADVDVGDAAVAVPFEEFSLPDVGGHDRAAEALGHGVVHGHGVSEIGIRDEVGEGSERLGVNDFGVIAQPNKAGVGVVSARIGEELLSANDFLSMGLDSFDSGLHVVEGFLIDDGTNEG